MFCFSMFWCPAWMEIKLRRCCQGFSPGWELPCVQYEKLLVGFFKRIVLFWFRKFLFCLFLTYLNNHSRLMLCEPVFIRDDVLLDNLQPGWIQGHGWMQLISTPQFPYCENTSCETKRKCECLRAVCFSTWFLHAWPPEWSVLLHKAEERKNERSQSQVVRN